MFIHGLKSVWLEASTVISVGDIFYSVADRVLIINYTLRMESFYACLMSNVCSKISEKKEDLTCNNVYRERFRLEGDTRECWKTHHYKAKWQSRHYILEKFLEEVKKTIWKFSNRLKASTITSKNYNPSKKIWSIESIKE